MFKAVLYNLSDRFAIHRILASNTFEPEFREWSDSESAELTQFQLIVYYAPALDIPLVRRIRESLNFFNIKVIVFCDNLDQEVKKDALVYGADYVELLPENDDELISMFKRCYFQLIESADFPREIIDAFQLSIVEILSTMALMNPEVAQVYRRTTQFHFGEVTGIMALAGEKKGAMLISLHEELARNIISSIIAVPASDLSEDDMNDGVGELVNMIAGGTKARLSDYEEDFLLSAPTVVLGAKHRVVQHKDMPCVIMVYEVEGFYFAVQVCLMRFLKG
jgi:chemotaxis protein CheX